MGLDLGPRVESLGPLTHLYYDGFWTAEKASPRFGLGQEWWHVLAFRFLLIHGARDILSASYMYVMTLKA